MVCKKCGFSDSSEENLDRCPMCDEPWENAREEDFGKAGGGDSWKQRSGPAITAAVVLVGVIVLVALLVGGLGGSSGGGGAPVGGTTTTLSATAQAQGATTYTDTALGYGFDYPSGWQVLGSAAGQGTSGATAVGRVSVFDPEGTVAGGEYVDLVHVLVYQLTAAVDESMMADVRTEVEQVVAGLQSQGNSTQVVEALSQTTAAGMQGFRATFTFATDGVPMTSTMYFLFSGDKEYQLTLQAATENWEAKSPTLEGILASFRPGQAN